MDELDIFWALINKLECWPQDFDFNTSTVVSSALVALE